MSPDNDTVVTAHQSGLLKLWNKNDTSLIKMWKGAHHGPITKLVFNPNSTIIASGGTDSSIRVWNHAQKVCLASLKGCQGVISVIVFHPDPDEKTIIAAGDDSKIIGWDFTTRQVTMALEGHFSKVTSIAYAQDRQFLVSASRDKVIILWNLTTKTQVRTIPLYESIEGAIVLKSNIKLPNSYKCDPKKVYVATGGEEGVIKVWELTEAKLIYTQTNSMVTKASEGELSITQLLYNEKNSLITVVSADHNIMIHNLSTFFCTKQLIGFNDDILDIIFVGKKNRYLAVATNSNDIKIYDTLDMNCKLMKGHTAVVLALSSMGNYILSSGRDNTVRLWKLNPADFSVQCIGVGNRHTGAVGSVAFGHISRTTFVSASQDTCIKLWALPKKLDDVNAANENETVELNCIATQIAHEKDINCVCISPNDKMIASCSQDKTAKLWDATNLSLLGVLRGHSRGVWTVKFSPVDQLLLTTSADCTMKLFTLNDMSCIKTIEGHESSILRGEFLSNGMQILSSSSDGLIKLWNIKTAENILTLEHDCKIWTLAITKDESVFYSGGSNSNLIKWRDVTEEKKVKEFAERQEEVLQEQELNNFLKDKKLLKALRIALKLDKPFLSLRIINNVIKQHKTNELEETISKLNELHKESLLKHVTTWNTNSKNSRPAQFVLNILLKEIVGGDLKISGLGKVIEETLPYTERHFNRLTEYMKDLKFLEYTLTCMQPHGADNIE